MLRSNKSGDTKISKDDLDALREKYEEEDLVIIEKIIKKNIQDHESSKLAQKEENIFYKSYPEVTDAQMKHLKFMQKEFGYSLKYAYDITFGGAEKKQAPKDHSISSKGGGESSSKKKQDSDDDAYADMQKFYT